MIHTIAGDPISAENLSVEEGTRLLRDTMATMYYQLMEKYGRSSRADLLSGYESAEAAWDAYLKLHTGDLKHYDAEVEQTADYRPKHIVLPQTVWKPVAGIIRPDKNSIMHVTAAKKLYLTAVKQTFRESISPFRKAILRISYERLNTL